MNHMVRQVGPRIRSGPSVDDYLRSVDNRPRVELAKNDPGFSVPGYPQKMEGMHQMPEMSHEAMMRINGRRETKGMRKNWAEGVKGLMTVVRVLPEELFEKVMHSDDPVEPGSSTPGAGPGQMSMGDMHGST